MWVPTLTIVESDYEGFCSSEEKNNTEKSTNEEDYFSNSSDGEQ